MNKLTPFHFSIRKNPEKKQDWQEKINPPKKNGKNSGKQTEKNKRQNSQKLKKTRKKNWNKKK